MSQYLNFYIRTETGFIPMHSYSSYSAMYDVFESYVPYGKISSITYEDLVDRVGHLTAKIKNCEEMIKEEKEKKALIAIMPDPIEDKLEYIADVDESIRQLKECIEDFTLCSGGLCFLRDFLDACVTDEHFGKIAPYLSSDKILYVGIEAPDYPTEEDIA